MRQQKNKEKDYYNGQPVNKPYHIARAIAALAADEKNHGILQEDFAQSV
jgi:hypothetical protein